MMVVSTASVCRWISICKKIHSTKGHSLVSLLTYYLLSYLRTPRSRLSL